MHKVKAYEENAIHSFYWLLKSSPLGSGTTHTVRFISHNFLPVVWDTNGSVLRIFLINFPAFHFNKQTMEKKNYDWMNC